IGVFRNRFEGCGVLAVDSINEFTLDNAIEEGNTAVSTVSAYAAAWASTCSANPRDWGSLKCIFQLPAINGLLIILMLVYMNIDARGKPSPIPCLRNWV
ncbi:hypothetical protein BRC21_02105, partial [Candidatus Saccharibacteria bacterium SW_7_54_9]